MRQGIGDCAKTVKHKAVAKHSRSVFFIRWYTGNQIYKITFTAGSRRKMPQKKVAFRLGEGLEKDGIETATATLANVT
jgi:hypothetical protein